MLNEQDAKKIVESTLGKVQVCVPYKGDFLVRVEYTSAEEANYDPFFLVKSGTGEVQEFSIMTDGDPEELAKAFGSQSGGEQ
jgi:hypothetical protein